MLLASIGLNVVLLIALFWLRGLYKQSYAYNEQLRTQNIGLAQEVGELKAAKDFIVFTSANH